MESVLQWRARAPAVLGDDDEIEASSDTSPANGSSIAFLAEYGGRRLRLTGDELDNVLTESLRRWRQEVDSAEPARLDALKLSHHGSVNNTSAQLMREVSADHSLVSTNGKRFQHPDALAIEFLLDEHWCFALTTKISRRTSRRIKLAARQDMETRPISCFDLGSGD